ncbi:prepilin peptidase [Cupriavidus sp. D384]|uniref:A24 family peptidase n=1 Tax=Cupriavidus sp. D384 TaxID=1538095 RepID=UPI0009ED0635|nr:prepilin peptidase [Cupriavidus sp. D384]
MTSFLPQILQNALAPAPGSLRLAALVLTPALLWVALSDLLYRRIGNRPVLALLVLWLTQLAWICVPGGQAPAWPEIARSSAAAAIVLVAGYALFAMRWAGAGDVKLMAVLCLWLGREVAMFLLVTSLAGGALALCMPVLRRIELTAARCIRRLGAWLPVAVPTPMALQGHSSPGIPYGVAIAAGAVFVLFRH